MMVEKNPEYQRGTPGVRGRESKVPPGTSGGTWAKMKCRDKNCQNREGVRAIEPRVGQSLTHHKSHNCSTLKLYDTILNGLKMIDFDIF